MPGAKCTICLSDQRAAAESAIAAGESVRQVAARLGLSYPSLDRHRVNCVPKSIARVRERTVAKADQHVAKAEETAAVQQDALGAALLARVERLQSITDLIIEKAMQDQGADHGLALKAIAQARRNLELIGRLTGTLEPNETKGDHLITFETFALMYQRVRLGKA